LKDLYAKTIPELAKFEQKMIDYTTENAVQKMIVDRFDVVISKKAAKQSIDDIYKHIENNVPSNKVLQETLNNFEK
jgi:hypothetical protein